MAGSDQDIVATNFLRFLQSDKQVIATEILEGNRLDAALPLIPVGYLYNLERGGYLLIATSRSLTPVKAYSLSGDFDALPPNYRAALLKEMEAQNRALKAEIRAPLGEAATENERRWNFLLDPDSARLPLAYTADTWLIDTKWNQEYPYNKFTPKINGQSTPTGCVNTAVAQILRYHRYPAASRGVVSYTWNDQLLKAILHRSCNWDNMPDVLDPTTPEYQVDEVARLMADLGIAHSTDYGLDCSSASVSIAVLTDYFGYSNQMQSMDNAVADAFFDTLKTEIDAERPVLLSFPGHQVIADGYASDDPTGRKIHINMGWGGSDDNFYFLDQPVETDSYIFDTINLSIFYNIKPCGGDDCVVNLETGDTMTDLTLTGQFHADKDVDRYEAYLKGDTTIKGSRGYSSIGFYIYLYNKSDGSLAGSINYDAAADTDIPVGALPAGKYVIEVNSCGHDNTCIPNPAGYESYTVTVSSGSPSDQEKTEIDRLLDIPPVINNTFETIVFDPSNPSTARVLVDARDENGDAVTLQVTNSNTGAFQATLNKNVLEITPAAGASNTAGQIVVQAVANGKTATKSFLVMIPEEFVSFGRNLEIKGLFENQADSNLHKVILDGACTISGWNNVDGGQSFYSWVLDKNGGTYVPAADSTISADFPENLYQIGASLQIALSGGGYTYFDYNDPDVNDRYALSIDCPDADLSLNTISSLLGIDLGANVFSDNIPPSGTVAINGGAESTGVISATLNLTCTDAGSCDQMQFSNDNIAWTDPEPYAGVKTWTLLPGDGTKTVYARFRDDAGNWSEIVSDTICLVTNQRGDINADHAVTLADAIIAFRLLTRMEPQMAVDSNADVNGDGNIGIEEIIYILQKISGIR